MIISKKNTRPKPVALIMIEGFGVSRPSDNNILTNSAPYFSHLAEHYPVSAISATGAEIGLPEGVVSNGEIGHAVIGSGIKFFDASQEIDEAIVAETFASGPQFSALEALIKDKTAVHLIGLLTNSEIEASINHLENLISYLETKNIKKIYIHCILDGRETKKNSGQKLIEEFYNFLDKHPTCEIVSMVGRLYALDGKSNLSRTAKAFKLMASADGNVFSSAKEAFIQIYKKKIFDEEFPPVSIRQDLNNLVTITDDDVVIFWNHVKHGARQLANYFLVNLLKTKLVTLTDYNLDKEVLILFPQPDKGDSIGKVFSDAGLKQLRISESAGFPNVTVAFDFYSKAFSNGLDKKLIPSSANIPLVDNALDTIKETRRLFIEAIQKSIYDLIVVTFPQIDLIAHNQKREDLSSVVKSFDVNIKLIIEAIDASGGVAIIVGTHGLAEQTIDPVTSLENFSHSFNLVPLFIIGKSFEGYNLGWPEALGGDLSLLQPIGSLVDIAPTILSLANLPIPKEMKGKSLIK